LPDQPHPPHGYPASVYGRVFFNSLSAGG
jgi:hypothetical protein